MNHNNLKKLLIASLSAVLTFGNVSTVVFAEEDQNQNGGGTNNH